MFQDETEIGLQEDYVSSESYDGDTKTTYRLGAQIGEGTFGVVRVCVKMSTDEIFACKTIRKENLKEPEDVKNLFSEFRTMTVLRNHPYAVKLEECIEDEESFHFIMELCSGGDLFTRTEKLRHYSERDAAIVCFKLACVLEYAHSRGVMHRDIKPENVLLASPDSNTDIRLADFGYATNFTPGQKLSELAGSPMFIAPSVLLRSYGPEADLWSLGVLLHILLCGGPPFAGDNDAQTFKSVLVSELNLRGPGWQHVSLSAKDLVRRLLVRNDKKRLTAKEVQEHPWILHHCTASVREESSANLKFSDQIRQTAQHVEC